MQRFVFSYRIFVLAVGMFFWSGPGQLSAQQRADSEDTDRYADMLPFPTDRITVPSWRYAQGPHVRSAFREVVKKVNSAAVRVRANGEKTAMGAIVDSDGWILTKASRLHGTITCELADGRELKARVVGVSHKYDAAVLKIDAKELPMLQIGDSEVPPVGSWLATVGMSRDPIAVGVISVGPRMVAHRAGILGVMLGDQNGHAIIERVFPKSGAEAAGLIADDVITAVNDVPTPNREQLIRAVRRFSPGDLVRLDVLRDDKSLELEALLTGDFPGQPPTREEYQNQLGGGLSQRRFGFPMAYQHDSVVDPTDCGGPVVNLDGKVVGFNIARAGRTETYAIPNVPLKKLLSELMPSNQPSASQQTDSAAETSKPDATKLVPTG